MGLHLSQIDEADELLTNDPLALLIGMVLDQPVSEGWNGRVFRARSTTRRHASFLALGAGDDVGV